MNVVGIIQARTGSTRLPGKVVKRIGNQTILEILLSRLKNATVLDEIVVATTTRKEDDIIEELALKNGVHVFRGSESNVLDRYCKAAEKYNADIVVRITSDNPLVSLELISQQVDYLIRENCDYIGSKGVILGTGIETFRFTSLKEAWNNASNEYELEHVTPYLYEHDKRIKIEYISPLKILERNDMRLTIDTQEDFDLYLQLEKAFGDLTTTSLNAIIEYLDKNENVRLLNQDVLQKNYRDI
ncbi:spore coat polysaccharide biosynthesis protein F, CMP-KDO synthetase [Methanolobus tindarius DSM 2278]|jgi:spore coat polysaccharide biosynthesis protein SpsF|uniref:Spore coat polysaccharide biosynthesis protein F, CMP-KDO synthetase n=1 Tax=Methanolobus tindarius DSM 2278 TaxID=1090322 RepID=W9DN85_METTI|nr:glycosyltransferase family protein [Methanolobus tindarius]ETA67459.1 spore coat polysaccharide biosynthesis protein F, CMP-KDO synthetase [Methanolobus tindarius DSM 2278]